MHHPTMTTRSLALAARAEGVATCDVPGLPTKKARALFNQLVNDGLLFRATLSLKVVRYFATAEQAKAWLKNRRTKPVKHGHSRIMAAWPADAEPRITSETKVPLCTSPQERIQVVDLFPNRGPVIRSGAMDYKQHQQHGRY